MTNGICFKKIINLQKWAISIQSSNACRFPASSGYWMAPYLEYGSRTHMVVDRRDYSVIISFVKRIWTSRAFWTDKGTRTHGWTGSDGFATPHWPKIRKVVKWRNIEIGYCVFTEKRIKKNGGTGSDGFATPRWPIIRKVVKWRNVIIGYCVLTEKNEI